MIRKVLLLLGSVLMMTACGAETPAPEAVTEESAETTETASGPAFLALHLYNPASDDTHQEFLASLAELNEAVASSGHPETEYRAWKVTGEQAGDFGYLFGSVWTNRAAYDAAHEHDDYKAVMARIEQAGSEPFAAEVYNRYVAVSAPATESPQVPAGNFTSLSLHLFNLPSAEAEAQLLGMFDDFNAAIDKAGHPETRYGLWKVTGEQTGDYAYVSGSLWADRAVYDAVHEHAEYKAVMETHQEAFENLIPEEVYNRYERLMLE